MPDALVAHLRGGLKTIRRLRGNVDETPPPFGRNEYSRRVRGGRPTGAPGTAWESPPPEFVTDRVKPLRQLRAGTRLGG
jgi:hypothetical protein